MRHLKTLLIIMTALSMGSCIKSELPNSEADIVEIKFPEGILTDAAVNYNNTYNSEIKAYPILVEVKDTCKLDGLCPKFILTPGAKIDPPSGESQNFNNPVKYKVTSEDGNWHRDYLIMVYHPVNKEIPSHYDFEHAKLNKNYHVVYQKEAGRRDLYFASGNAGFAITAGSSGAEKYPTTLAAPGFESDSCLCLTTRYTGIFGAMVGKPIAAGNLFMGDFDGSHAMGDALKCTRFGVPVIHKPLKISGMYKYKVGTGNSYNFKEGEKDDFDIYAVLFEKSVEKPYLDGHLPIEGFRDSCIVAVARVADEIKKETDEWTKFEMVFNYQIGINKFNRAKLEARRYSMAFVMSSSKGGALFKGTVGSCLKVDDVEIKFEGIE